MDTPDHEPTPDRRAMDAPERLATYCGVLAPVISLSCVLGATILASDSEFTWQAYALSDLGRPTASTHLLFNFGLIAGGGLGLGVVWPLWADARNYLERTAAGLLVVSLLSLALIGVYHLPRDPHQLVALLFFVTGPITHWVYGTGRVLAGKTRIGLASLWLGNGHALGWGGWIIFLAIAQPGEQNWFAVPEMIAALAFGGWAIMVSLSLLGDR